MTLLSLLLALQARCVVLQARNGGIAFKDPFRPLSQGQKDEIIRWKPVLLALLSGSGESIGLEICDTHAWPDFQKIDSDQWEEFEERAAVLEYEAAFPRPWAEVLAAAELGLFSDSPRVPESSGAVT